MRTEHPREGSRHGDEHTDANTMSMLRMVRVIVTPLPAASDAADPRAPIRSDLHDAATRTIVAVRSGASLDKAICQAREHVRAACVIARGRDVRAEQVVLLMKDVFRTLASPRFITRVDAEVMLARLVTLCILTYYSSDRS